MGDTVAVVVSEERGKTSVAVNGRLFEMKSAKELEANLSYLLGLKEYGGEQKTFFGKILDKFRRNKDDNQDVLSQEEVENAAKSKPVAAAVPVSAKTQVETAGEAAVPIAIRTQVADQTSNSKRVGTATRILFLVVSIFLSLLLWMYIQINTNPVVSKTITVPIQYNDENKPENYEVSYPVKTVELEIVGRAGTLNSMTADDIVATIDYSKIEEGATGVIQLPVNVSGADGNTYFRVETQTPEYVDVIVYSVD